jgi:hypothetical protein
VQYNAEIRQCKLKVRLVVQYNAEIRQNKLKVRLVVQLQYNAEIQQFIDSNFMFPFLGLKNNLYLILTYLIFSPTKNSEIYNFYLILNVFSRYYLVSEHFFPVFRMLLS